MMKAGFFRQHGGPEVLEYGDLPEPVAGPDEVLVRVRAAALNHLDLFVREGLPGLKLQFPHIGACDMAGEVAATGEAVTGWREGERVIINPNMWCGQCELCVAGEESMCDSYGVIGEHMTGGAAEYIAVPARNLRRIPADFPFEQAAAVPLVWMTAWRALIGQAGLRAGQSVLILGAGGGAATAAIQIARYAGATVYAASRSDEKLAKARQLGADHTVRSDGDFGREIWRLTGKRGVDVVLENVGAATWEQSLRVLVKGGTLVTYGATTGPIVNIDLRKLFWRQFSIVGSTMANNREFETVMRLVFDEKRFTPVVDRVFPLSEIRAAHEYLASGEQFGKVVLLP
ncbi:MAG TPA: zinc-binding dehydrogenase [Herpetosiphonaceae bacterium]|nr:zinc-binding dehydrogenase [Herpetosiphonaceae bacterium]